MRQIKFAVSLPNHDFAAARAMAERAEALGYHSVSMDDHFFMRGLMETPQTPHLECFTALSALASRDEACPVGPDGHLDVVPQSRSAREDHFHARPYQRRPGDGRRRRGMVPRGIRGLRLSVSVERRTHRPARRRNQGAQGDVDRGRADLSRPLLQDRKSLELSETGAETASAAADRRLGQQRAQDHGG